MIILKNINVIPKNRHNLNRINMCLIDDINKQPILFFHKKRNDNKFRINMWQSPIYRFKSETDEGIGKLKYKEFTINVTNSAPPMKTPGKQLENIFDYVLNRFDPSKTKILDLGAARLRNSKYLVEKGFQVYSADFEDLFKEGSAGYNRLKELEESENFNQLIFPKDILNINEKFDVILLINVLTVMPIPIERLCLTSLIRKLISDKGIFLWISDPMIRNKKNEYKRPLIDGFLTGVKRKKVESFYVELHEEVIRAMIELSGFKINKDISKNSKKFSRRNIIYSASPTRKPIFSRSFNFDDLKINGTANQENYYSSVEFKSILEIMRDELIKTEPGNVDSFRYHLLIAHTIHNIFKNQLRNMTTEKKGREGDIRYDITFRRDDNPGFFRDLKELYSIYCPFIKMECKNYTGKIGNEEFDQLYGRLSEVSGLFGIIFVRTIEDRNQIRKHCKDRYLESLGKKFILVLEDADVHDLISAKIQNSKEYNEILHHKMEEIFF